MYPKVKVVSAGKDISWCVQYVQEKRINLETLFALFNQMPYVENSVLCQQTFAHILQLYGLEERPCCQLTLMQGHRC